MFKKICTLMVFTFIVILMTSTSSKATIHYVDSKNAYDEDGNASAVVYADFYYDDEVSQEMWIVYAEWGVTAVFWGVYSLDFNYEQQGGDAFIWSKSKKAWYNACGTDSYGWFKVSCMAGQGTAVAKTKLVKR